MLIIQPFNGKVLSFSFNLFFPLVPARILAYQVSSIIA
jgi:hypothetical protein